MTRSLLRPSLGVNVSELARKLAKEMERAKDQALRDERDAKHEYALREEWQCIGRKLVNGYSLETVSVPRGCRDVLRATGPTIEGATANLRVELVRDLVRRKRCTADEARLRAAEVSVRVCDVLGEE